jgi:hypothetical protein
MLDVIAKLVTPRGARPVSMLQQEWLSIMHRNLDRYSDLLTHLLVIALQHQLR